MKTIRLLLFLSIITLLQSCCFLCYDDDDPITIRDKYDPVIMQREDFESAVSLLPSRAIENSGKIYIKDNLLFINEVNNGFHVYDNANPEAPQALRFIKAPGATDIAIRDQILYINQAVDLIAIQFDADTDQFEVTKRIRDIFPSKLSPNNDSYYSNNDDEIVIDWIPSNN